MVISWRSISSTANKSLYFIIPLTFKPKYEAFKSHHKRSQHGERMPSRSLANRMGQHREETISPQATNLQPTPRSLAKNRGTERLCGSRSKRQCQRGDRCWRWLGYSSKAILRSSKNFFLSSQTLMATLR